MSKDKNGWTEETSGDRIETWDYKTQKEIQGVYKRLVANVGPNQSNLYHVEVKGEIIGVWGTALLNNMFGGIEVGEEVRVVYEGMGTSEKTGREYHNFRFFHRKVK